MGQILRAYACALQSLFQRGIWFHLLWPLALSIAAWVAIGIIFWGRLTRILLDILRHRPMLADYLSQGGIAEHALGFTLTLALYLISIPFVFLTATLLLELVSLPLLIDKVAKADYPHLERRAGGTLWKSLQNTFISVVVVSVVTGLTLPLWIFPAMGIMISFVLTTWLNYRSFRYDVLVSHADVAEIAALPRAHRGRLLVLASAIGVFNLIPLVNFFSVPLVGLAFAHYLLHALDQLRKPLSPIEHPSMTTP